MQTSVSCLIPYSVGFMNIDIHDSSFLRHLMLSHATLYTVLQHVTGKRVAHMLLHIGEIPGSVLARRLSILNEVSCGFLQSFQAKASLVPQIRL
jgi:hypothetical protein